MLFILVKCQVSERGAGGLKTRKKLSADFGVFSYLFSINKNNCFFIGEVGPCLHFFFYRKMTINIGKETFFLKYIGLLFKNIKVDLYM